MAEELEGPEPLPAEGDGVRVGINAAIRRRGISGTARIVDHICSALAAEPDIEAFTVQPSWRSRRTRLGNALRDSYWDLWRASRPVTRPDVFVSPCNVGSAPAGTAHLLWIHDTVVLDHPEWHDPGYVRYAWLLFAASVRRCDRIVTGSRDAAARIRARWPDCPPISVLHWPAPRLGADGPRTAPASGRDVLMVAASEYHKNHTAAIEAVRLARLHSGEDIRLVLVGPQGRAEAELQAQIQVADPAGDWLLRRAATSDEELQRLYGSCWALLQPAFDEGFGLPLLEAAAHAAPVVHSGRGGMPEVVPCSGGSVHGGQLAEALLELLDPARYQAASQAALAAARSHSPARFRQRLATLIREAAG